MRSGARGVVESDKMEALLRLYEEERAMARHHEGQRASSTNFLLTLDAAVLGVIAALVANRTALSQALFSSLVAASFVFLSLLGLYGALVSLKHFERSRFHDDRAWTYRKYLDKILHQPARTLPTFQDMIDEAREKHAVEWRNKKRPQTTAQKPFVVGLNLHNLWLAIHLAILGGSLVALVVQLLTP